MSLERQDVRAKLDPDMHEALVAICEAKGITQGEFIEALVVPELKRLVHEATVITERMRNIPPVGNNREFPGFSAPARERGGRR